MHLLNIEQLLSENKDEEGNQHIQTSKKHFYWTFASFMRTQYWVRHTQSNLFQPMSIYILFTMPVPQFHHVHCFILLKSSTPFIRFSSFLFWWSCINTRNIHKTFHETERCVFIFLLKCHRFLLKFVNSEEKFSFHTYITSWMKALQRPFQHASSRFFSVLNLEQNSGMK